MNAEILTSRSAWSFTDAKVAKANSVVLSVIGTTGMLTTKSLGVREER